MHQVQHEPARRAPQQEERRPGGHVITARSDLELAKKRNKTLALTKAGVVTADMYWERITYFLERVVSRWRTSTRFGWRAIRTTRSFRTAAIRASIPCCRGPKVSSGS